MLAELPSRFQRELKPVSGTNYQPRMSTGLELQVILPVVNAPFRVYYAYNPLRIDETVASPTPITRGMFPPGAAGDYTYRAGHFGLPAQLPLA